MNARCTTTSAPETRSSTAARSRMSPRRYSVLCQPSSLGSNGRRAIASTRETSGVASSAATNGLPISPVGPVTATVNLEGLAIVERWSYPPRPAGGEPGAPPEPLFSLDQNEFETAIAADHANVEETARKSSRSEVEAAIEAIASAERVLIACTDQMAFFASYMRHLLML